MVEVPDIIKEYIPYLSSDLKQYVNEALALNLEQKYENNLEIEKILEDEKTPPRPSPIGCTRAIKIPVKLPDRTTSYYDLDEILYMHKLSPNPEDPNTLRNPKTQETFTLKDILPARDLLYKLRDIVNTEEEKRFSSLTVTMFQPSKNVSKGEQGQVQSDAATNFSP